MSNEQEERPHRMLAVPLEACWGILNRDGFGQNYPHGLFQESTLMLQSRSRRERRQSQRQMTGRNTLGGHRCQASHTRDEHPFCNPDLPLK